MKCEACLSLLEEYVDSELAGREAEQVGAHLMGCATCAAERELLSAELEIYSRYDRALAISPAMWSEIAERSAPANEVAGNIPRAGLSARFASLFRMPALGLSFAGALAVLLLATAIGVAYLRTRKAAVPKDPIAGNGQHRMAPAAGRKELPPKGQRYRIVPVTTES
jgi:anti-sigma factor RsiW